MKKRKLFIFLAFVVPFCFLLLFWQKRSSNSWAVFVSNGVINSSRILKKNDTLIYGTSGTNYPKLYFLNSFDRNEVETIDLNTGDARLQAFFGNTILVTTDDQLVSINIKSKKILWQFSTEGQKFIKKVVVYNNRALATSADGSLYVFRPKSGELLWKFSPKKVNNPLSSIIIDANLNYYSNFTIEGNTVYLASPDKTLYALNLRNGKTLWETNIDSIVVSEPMVYGNYLYLTTNSGKTISFNKRNGKLIWQASSKSQVNCFEVRPTFKNFNNPFAQTLSQLAEHTKNLFIFGRLAYYELHNDGTFIRRDAKTGEVIWQSEKLPSGLNCPTFWKSRVVFTGNKGNFIIMSTDTGEKLFDQNIFGIMVNSAIAEPRFGNLFPEWLDVFTPNYYIYNIDGDISLIRGSTAKVLWKFSASAPTNTVAMIDKKNVYFATSDGVIYKLDKKTGLPELSKHDQKFKLSESTKSILDTEIHEFTLESNGDFNNPWREADLNATFTHESGLTVHIPGFYYDHNIWKLRFNPPLKGKWKWEIGWIPNGMKLSKSGEFVSETDTSNFYLRTSTVNPKRLTVDGTNIFNGIGIGDTMVDYNYNGTTLDDWALGNSNPVIATDSAGRTIKYRSDKVNTLEDYIMAYGPKGAGFNMFRWSLMNSSESLWTNFGYPTTYSILQGKVGDSFAESLRSSGIHLWFTLFGFDIPYKGSITPRDKYLLKSYIRYVYARYGAYVDIWELANEIAVPQDTASMLFNEIKAYDYENRPISISSVGYNYDKSEVIAPHWYETERVEESDKKTSEQIGAFEGIKKPVVIAEQGNHTTNYDGTSAIRMRIRAWTAFFEQGILMFWNQSDSKDFKSGIFSANIYLGEVERSYTRVLQNYTKSFPLESKKVEYHLDRFGVRGYGLTSDNLNAGYFFHYSDPFSPTNFSLTLFTKNGGEAQWIDPATGNIIQTKSCWPGNCILSSPVFMTDIAVFIKPTNDNNNDK